MKHEDTQTLAVEPMTVEPMTVGGVGDEQNESGLGTTRGMIELVVTVSRKRPDSEDCSRGRGVRSQPSPAAYICGRRGQGGGL